MKLVVDLRNVLVEDLIVDLVRVRGKLDRGHIRQLERTRRSLGGGEHTDVNSFKRNGGTGSKR